MIYNIVSLLVGWTIAALVAPFVLYPLLYSLPRALVDAGRGRAAWWRPLVYLAIPVLMFISLVVTGYLLAFIGIAAPVLRYMRSAGFVWGEWIGIGLALARLLTPTGRRKLNADYINSQGRPKV